MWPFNGLEFAGGKPGIEVGANLGVGDLAHAAAQRVANDCSLVHDGFALEVLIAGKGDRFPDALLRVQFLLRGSERAHAPREPRLRPGCHIRWQASDAPP